MTKKILATTQTLRERAETILQASKTMQEAITPEEYMQLLHELQVHQIELELQNEELRNSQNNLEESRSRYMQLYHNAPVGYVVLNHVGIIKQVNATFAAMVEAEEGRNILLGKPFADYLVPEDKRIFLARAKSFFKNPVDKQIEVRIGNADATRLVVNLEATPLHRIETAQGQHEDELLVTVSDITQRVKAEEELSKSRTFIRSVIDSLSAHVCVLDENGIILTVNDAWRKFAAANPPVKNNICEGIDYLAVCDNVQGEEAAMAHAFAEGIRSVLQGEKNLFSLEYPCHSEDEERWFVGRVTRLDGNPKGAVVAHENISERKRLEKEQLQLQKRVNQLDKSESLGLMAGAVAHNFNNKLAAVLGYIEIAIEDMRLANVSCWSLDASFKAAQQAAEMSGQMLTYLGQTTEKKECIDLSDVCSEELSRLLLANPHHLGIVNDFQMSGPTVKANSKLVQRIVSNLVINAWESMGGQKGSLRVRVSTIGSEEIAVEHRFPIDWQPQASAYACLEVRDEGSGIALKDMDKLFDPFFTSKFTGRGLGLSVVLGILRAYDGCVTVQSQPDQGSIFRVYIPTENAQMGT